MARSSDSPDDRKKNSRISSDQNRLVEKPSANTPLDDPSSLNGVNHPEKYQNGTYSNSGKLDYLNSSGALGKVPLVDKASIHKDSITPTESIDSRPIDSRPIDSRLKDSRSTDSRSKDSRSTDGGRASNRVSDLYNKGSDAVSAKEVNQMVTASRKSSDAQTHEAQMNSINLLCRRIGADLIDSLNCDSVIVSRFRDKETISVACVREERGGPRRAPTAILTAPEGRLLIDGQRVALPWIVINVDDAQLTSAVRKRFQGRGISSFVAWELSHGEGWPQGLGWVECHFYHQRPPLTRDEFNRLFQICEEGSHAIRFLEEGHKAKVNASLANLFAELPCGVVELSNDNRILYLNRTAQAILGSESVLSKPFLLTLKGLLKGDTSQILVELDRALHLDTGYKGKLDVIGGAVSINLLRSEDDHGGSKLLLIWREVRGYQGTDPLSQQFIRLVEDAHVIVVRADRRLVITELIGDTNHLLGIESERLKTTRQAWINLVSRRDLQRLIKRVKAQAHTKFPVEEEFEVIHGQDGSKRAFLVRIKTILGDKGGIQGYEAIAFDITDKRRVQQELLLNKRRLEAVNTVTDVLEDVESPTQVGMLGLRTLMEAIGANAGFIASVGGNGLEIMATKGLSIEALNLIEQSSLNVPPLSSLIKSRRSLVSENVTADANFEESYLSTLGFKSAVLSPVLLGDQCRGVVCLFSQSRGAFSEYDAQIISSAATQILHAGDEIERRIREREDAQGLAALYRLSSEISRYKHPSQIAKQAFPIIKEVCPYKRIWFGIANEVKSHIMGQAAEGPGIRKQIERVQVELSLRHDFFDQAVETQQPVIVPAGSKAECSGLNRIINALQVETLLIMPLVSVGQLIGVLVIEPTDPSVSSLEKKVSILKSMVGEIATVLLARNYEARIADAEKMRAAGLLASGVAHNFNNLLQAIMGQAAILQMSSKGSEDIAHSAAQILEASKRGAQIVQHLLAFSKIEREKDSIRLDLVDLINESRGRFNEILGNEIHLEIDVAVDSAPVHGNYQQVKQVIDELITNAREALVGASHPRVLIGVSLKRVTSNAVNPDLSPGQYVQIVVEDNGVGMSMDQQNRCFEPFFTTRGVNNDVGLGLTGTGLGLAAAYTIVRSHKGMLTVEGEPGKGARFTLLLPIWDDGALRRLASLEEMEIVPDILAVNLTADVVKGVRQICNSVGLTSLASDSWNSAIIFSKVSHTHPRLVILDVDNVSFKVSEFIRGLVDEGKRLRLVLLTSSAPELESELSGIERVDIIQKPLSGGTMQNLVRRLFLSRSSQGLQSRIDTSVTHEASSGFIKEF